MKCYPKRGLALMVAVASLGLGTAATALAQSDTGGAGSGSSATHSHHSAEHGPGGMILGTTLQATKKLNLTAAQKSQIKTIMHTAHEQEKEQMGKMDPAVLGDPSNPGYSAAVQSLKSGAADRIQRETEVQSQIYNVLTPDQKAKLPSVLANIKTKHEGHHAASAEEHTPSTR
jgi:Spy/CpxP family protein refolding chaperone